jgi:Amiloride-sensitive sodium channel
VVKHSPHNGKVKGSIPAALSGIGMGLRKWRLKKLLFVTSYFHPNLKFADPRSLPLRLIYNICKYSAKLVRLKEQLKNILHFKIPFFPLSITTHKIVINIIDTVNKPDLIQLASIHNPIKSSCYFQNFRSLLKYCTWKGKPVPCGSIFKTIPTDRGMCCAFNLV